MGFRRTCGSAHAVTAGTPAEQEHPISRTRFSPAQPGLRNGSDHGSDFQVFGNVARMKQFPHLGARQTNLISIRRKTSGGTEGYFTLGKFAGQGGFKRRVDISCAGEAQSLIDPGAPGKRITNGPAQTSGRPAVRFNFRGMIVRLILEHEKPGLFHTIAQTFGLDTDRTGIDFVRNFLLFQQAAPPQLAAHDRGNIHETERLFTAAVGLAKSLITGQGGVKFVLEAVALVAYVAELGVESGVTAVVGPIGIQHLDFQVVGFAFFTAEFIANEPQVIDIHGQAMLPDEIFESCFIKLAEAGIHGHVFAARTVLCREHRASCRLGFKPVAELDFAVFQRVDEL